MKEIELEKMEEAARVGRLATRPTESDRRAIILAGGDGTRLRSLTRVIAGGARSL